MVLCSVTIPTDQEPKMDISWKPLPEGMQPLWLQPQPPVAGPDTYYVKDQTVRAIDEDGGFVLKVWKECSCSAPQAACDNCCLGDLVFFGSEDELLDSIGAEYRSDVLDAGLMIYRVARPNPPTGAILYAASGTRKLPQYAMSRLDRLRWRWQTWQEVGPEDERFLADNYGPRPAPLGQNIFPA